MQRTQIVSAAGLLLCVAPVAAFGGCNFPVSTSKYEVERVADGETRIVRAFSPSSSVCGSCVRSECHEQVEACASTPGCVDFTECVRSEHDPAAQARCGGKQVGLEQVKAYVAVRECYALCIEECPIGTDWSCVDSYRPHRVQVSPIHIQQQFSYVGTFGPVSNAHVEFCALGGSECLWVVPPATTDREGTYTVALPIDTTSAALAWWSGARRVEAPAIHPHRLERNVPIWSHHAEKTGLVTAQLLELRVTLFEALREVEIQPLAYFLLQVFDCQLTGAPEVVFSLPAAPEAMIEYLDPRSAEPGQFTSTTALGGGAAAVLNVEVGREYEVVAKRADTGEEVASGKVYVSGTEITQLSLFPEPTE